MKETIYIMLSKVINLSIKGQPHEQVEGELKITIDNTTKNIYEVNEPVKYITGCYLIIDLAGGEYRLTIDSKRYKQVVQNIQISYPVNIETFITNIQLELKEMNRIETI